MDIVIVVIAAFGASMLTFFSGFGLGTILTPVFMLFFPIEVAIAMTGIVHLLNNLFKFTLIGRRVVIKIFLTFGLPAIIGAFAGARLLTSLSGPHAPLFTYNMFGHELRVLPVNLVISLLMVLFGIIELIPRLKKLTFNSKYLVPGGLLSGFFGGLSGHQGALRTAFLVKLGLSKESFIATGIAVSLLIDLTRLPVYYSRMLNLADLRFDWKIIAIATFSAFGGAFLGRQLLRKITIDFIHTIVGLAIIILGIGLGMGIIN